MAITWPDVTTAFPNDTTLAAVGSTEAAIYIDWVETQVDEACLGDATDQLRTLLAAHLGTLAASGGFGASGPVASESVDGVSRSYAVTASTTLSDLGATFYGRRAAYLIETEPSTGLPEMF